MITEQEIIAKIYEFSDVPESGYETHKVEYRVLERDFGKLAKAIIELIK